MINRIVAAVLVVFGVSMTSRGQEETNLPATLQNTGFEAPSIVAGGNTGAKPENWFYFSSTAEDNKCGVTAARKRSGLQSCYLKCLSPTNSYHGLAQKFAAFPGRHYTFLTYALNNPEDPMAGDAYGQVSVEWHNAQGVEISRVHGPVWNFQLPSSKWEKFLVEADAPTDTVAGVAVITFFSQNAGGVGSFYVDDSEITSRGGVAK